MPSAMSSVSALPLAAIVYRPSTPVEALMAEVVARLRAGGRRVGGVLQHDLAGSEGRVCQMELEDIGNGRRIALSQDLGSGSVSCAVDSAGLAEAAMAVRRAVDERVEVVIINKFGTQEVAGGGLRAEMGLVVAAGLPLLTAVGERYLQAWQGFTGGDAVLLPPVLDDILAWCDGLVATGAVGD